MMEDVLYFPNLVDVVIAPKCGWQSTHQLCFIAWGPKFLDSRKSFEYKKGGPNNWRELQYWEKGDITDLPFRKNSVRFAIKRDPVKRFLSAVDYLQGQRIVKVSHRDYPKGGFSSLENVVSAMERGTLFNKHLAPQTYFYGENQGKYHHIYDIKNLGECFLHIKELCRSRRLENYPAEKVHKNISTKSLSLEATDDIIERIKVLYKIDYDNGWC